MVARLKGIGAYENAQIVVTADMFARYFFASYWYLLEMRGRKYKHDGLERPETLVKVRASPSGSEPVIT